MKKSLSVILAAALCLFLCGILPAWGAAGAGDTVTMNSAGLSFTPTELIRNAAGTVVTNGEVPLGEDRYMAIWLYYPMTEEEYAAAAASAEGLADVPCVMLFCAFSLGGNLGFHEYNKEYLDETFPTDYVHVIGHEGEQLFYLFMPPADRDFAASLPAEYRAEYQALAEDTEQTVAAFTGFAPVRAQDE